MSGHASVPGGKFHRTVAAEPTFTREETSECGVTFRPMNVSYPEPPTYVQPRVSLCRKCFPPAEIAALQAAWAARNGVRA